MHARSSLGVCPSAVRLDSCAGRQKQERWAFRNPLVGKVAYKCTLAKPCASSKSNQHTTRAWLKLCAHPTGASVGIVPQVRLGTLAIPGSAAKLRSRILRGSHAGVCVCSNMGYAQPMVRRCAGMMVWCSVPWLVWSREAKFC